MYLIDSNIWLELLLEQERAEEVQELLSEAEAISLSITEFSLYSIGVILTKLNKDDIFRDFLKDTFVDSGVKLFRLNSDDLKKLLLNREQYRLDFDDAYQYTAAEKFDLQIVSFDKDFDKTPRGRKLPGEI
jgi:hypothetical protein